MVSCAPVGYRRNACRACLFPRLRPRAVVGGVVKHVRAFDRNSLFDRNLDYDLDIQRNLAGGRAQPGGQLPGPGRLRKPFRRCQGIGRGIARDDREFALPERPGTRSRCSRPCRRLPDRCCQVLSSGRIVELSGIDKGGDPAQTVFWILRTKYPKCNSTRCAWLEIAWRYATSAGIFMPQQEIRCPNTRRSRRDIIWHCCDFERSGGDFLSNQLTGTRGASPCRRRGCQYDAGSVS
jgi:hypothetical protein